MNLAYPDYKKLVMMVIDKWEVKPLHIEKFCDDNRQIIHDAMAFEVEPNVCAEALKSALNAML